jgi:hypothetical protein
MSEKLAVKFSRNNANSTSLSGFCNVPQSCYMGQTVLLPLRRKASVGSEPAILGTRGQHANH